MKAPSQVTHRVNELLIEEFDRRVAEAHKRLPHRCVHNHRQPLDTRKLADGDLNETFNRVTNNRHLPVLQTIGLCMVDSASPDDWAGTICEDDLDAQRCPIFVPVESKEALLDQFQRDISSPRWLMDHMPAAAELLWVVNDYTRHGLPWWKRLWFWALRIKIETVAPPLDPVLLLGDGSKDG